MLQGLTVWYLLRRLLKTPQKGDTVLWHAAAGVEDQADVAGRQVRPDVRRHREQHLQRPNNSGRRLPGIRHASHCPGL